MAQAASGIDLFIPEVYDIVWSLIILVIVAVFFYQLSTARVDAAKIRDDARAEASHIISDARSRAESDAAQITASAQRSIESQQQQAIVSLKGEVGALATALAGKILGAKLEDNDVQSSMIDSMIDDLDAKK